MKPIDIARVEHIRDTIALRYGIEPRAIGGAGKAAPLPQCRRFIFGLCRSQLPELTIGQIAHVLDLDPTWWTTAKRLLQRELDTDMELRARYGALSLAVRVTLPAVKPLTEDAITAAVEDEIERLRDACAVARQKDPGGLLRALRRAAEGVAVVLMLAIVPASAQPIELPRCQPQRAMIEQLQRDFGETVVAGGDDLRGVSIGVFAREDGASWTILIFQHGTACIMATGRDWAGRAVPAPPPLPERPA